MSKNSLSFGTLALVLAFALLGGFLGGAAMVNLNQSRSQAVGAQNAVKSEDKVYVEESQVIDTVKKVSPSVVSIVISKDLPMLRQGQFNADPFGFNDPFFSQPFNFQVPERDSQGNVKKSPQKVGGGSGFIVTADGLVVTNRHVVEDPEAEYTVVLSDQTEYPAEVVSRDTVNDMAILRIKPKDGSKLKTLPVAALGDTSQLQIGQKVVAIGNALGEYGNTVTTGVISAKGRSIQAGEINSAESLINLLQTDAAINPGNSGGPLVNLNGEVIGINTAIASGAQGIGFAIPINDVKSVIESVEKNGKIIRPYLGVRFMMLDEAKAKELQIDVKGGALLVGDESKGEFAVVPGSPAEKAGLKMKDVILDVDGATVTLDNPLQTLVAKKNPGDTVTLKVWRSGKVMNVSVALEEAK